MPFADYVELVAPLHDDRFHLVNRRVENGSVAIKKEERYELVRERIRLMLRRELPHKVPPALCEQLAPRVTLLKKRTRNRCSSSSGRSRRVHSLPACSP